MDAASPRPPASPESRRLALLADAAASLLTTLRSEEALGRLLALAREALAADAYAVWRRHAPEGRWEAIAWSGVGAQYLAEAAARFAHDSPAPREPIAVEDADAEPLLHAHRDAQRAEGIQSLLMAPLATRGEPDAALVFYYRSKRRFTTADIDAAMLVARLASTAMANAQMHDEKAESERRYRFLAEHGTDVVLRIGRDGTILDASPAARRVLGRAPEALVGRHAASVLDPADFEALVRQKDAGQEAPLVVRARDARGKLMHLEALSRGSEGTQAGEMVASFRDVSRRRAAERDLRLHARVLESMVEGVSVSTAEGVIVYTNPAEDAMFGREPGELLGQRLGMQSALPPEERARVVESILQELRARGYWEGEFQNERRDGSRFTTHARITRVDLDGAPHWVCVQEDVSERKRLEAQERESARRLAMLMRVQEELARDLDLGRVVQSATDAATSLTGAAFGAFFYNVTDPDGARYMLYTLSGVPREAFEKFPMPRATELFGPTFRGEGILRSDDITQDPRYGRNAPHRGMPPGHLPVRSYLAVPVVSGTGVVHGGLFLGHPEPSRFTRESEELAASIAAHTAMALDNALLYRSAKEGERRLAESEARFRTLVTATTQMVWRTDAQGRTLDMPEWRAFTGQSEEELQDEGWIDALHPEDRQRVMATWTGALGRRATYECEYRVRSASGEYRHFLARAIPRVDDGGNLIEYIGTWTDITPQKQALREAEALRQQLVQGEKMAALGSLVSGIAHELRTPLTFLATNAFLVQTRLDRAARRGATAAQALEEAEPFLQELGAGVDRINQLVDDLRRYTRGGLSDKWTNEPLDALVREAVDLFRAATRTAGPVVAHIEPTPAFRVQRNPLQRVLLNLMQNAVEASPPGAPIVVTCSPTPDGGASLAVADEGVGIPPHVQARMWEPLYTTKAHGTGLGLSIVKRIVDEHGARVECETHEGKGTLFRVVFAGPQRGESKR